MNLLTSRATYERKHQGLAQHSTDGSSYACQTTFPMPGQGLISLLNGTILGWVMEETNITAQCLKHWFGDGTEF